jgi:hypothetical protein
VKQIGITLNSILRSIFLFVAAMTLAGCQYDPHGNLYTTSEPKVEDLVGTYVLDRFDLPMDTSKINCEVIVELNPDGTFTAKNVPPWGMDEVKTNFFNSLCSGTGKWEKHTSGTLDPGNKSIWGVYLRTPDNSLHPADCTGDKPPYGLIFTLGDPDSGYAVLLKKK